MPLTDTQIRQIKASDKTIKLFDGGGLFLQVSPKGGKWWRLKYRFDGKEKLLSLGVYPDVGLKEARQRRQEAKNLLANSIDPSAYKKQQKDDFLAKHVNTFQTIAEEWFIKHQNKWTPSYAKRTLNRLEADIFPWLGDLPMIDITPPLLLKTVRRIEERGAIETAHRLLGICGQIFRYAIATGRAQRDITHDLRGALSPAQSKHFASITDPKKAGELLCTFDSYQGSLIVRSALLFAALVFVRPGELRHAKWADINMDGAEWRYIVTKTKTPHIVPLSKQAIRILQELKPLTGCSEYVFPSARSNRRPMSDNAILAALRRMGIPKEEMSGHGFRAMARTMLDEVLKVRPDYIEHQLAHAVRDPNGRAYNRTAYLPERHEMMQRWADYLDQLRSDHLNQ